MPSKLALFAQRAGALHGFLAVGLGAMGAHAIKKILIENYTWDGWQLATNFQLFHALALLAIGQTNALRTGPVVCWTLGAFLFSGSLYVLTYSPTQHWAGPITPLGGISLLVGWAWLFFTIGSPKKSA